jgi:hypothetical protein
MRACYLQHRARPAYQQPPAPGRRRQAEEPKRRNRGSRLVSREGRFDPGGKPVEGALEASQIAGRSREGAAQRVDIAGQIGVDHRANPRQLGVDDASEGGKVTLDVNPGTPGGAAEI